MTVKEKIKKGIEAFDGLMGKNKHEMKAELDRLSKILIMKEALDHALSEISRLENLLAGRSK